MSRRFLTTLFQVDRCEIASEIHDSRKPLHHCILALFGKHYSKPAHDVVNPSVIHHLKLSVERDDMLIYLPVPPEWVISD
jgi:hypothetical protein